MKYTDVRVELDQPDRAIRSSPPRSRPIPTVGFVARGYLAKNFAVGGEISFFRVPDSISEDYDGSYTDYDIYGTVNFTENVGATSGYRSVDVFFKADRDTGALKFKGLYFVGVVRF